MILQAFLSSMALPALVLTLVTMDAQLACNQGLTPEHLGNVNWVLTWKLLAETESQAGSAIPGFPEENAVSPVLLVNSFCSSVRFIIYMIRYTCPTDIEGHHLTMKATL